MVGKVYAIRHANLREDLRGAICAVEDLIAEMQRSRAARPPPDEDDVCSSWSDAGYCAALRDVSAFLGRLCSGATISRFETAGPYADVEIADLDLSEAQ